MVVISKKPFLKAVYRSYFTCFLHKAFHWTPGRIPWVTNADASVVVFLSAELFQSYPILCDTMDCNSPDSSVRGSLQARILEWVAMPSSRGSSRPKDQTYVSYISSTGWGVFFTTSATREASSLSLDAFMFKGASLSRGFIWNIQIMQLPL